MPSPPFLGNGVGAIAMQNVEIKVVLLRHLAFGHDDTPSRLRLFRLGGPRNGWAILFQFLVIQVCALPPADGSRTSCPCGDAAASLGAAALASASTRRCSGRTLGAQAASRKRSAMLPRGSENRFGYGVNGCAAVWCMNIPPVGLCCMDPAWLRADG